MKKLTISVITIGLMITFFSCKTPQTLATTNLSGDDTVIVNVKDTAMVKITDNPSTGYKWYYNENSGGKILTYEGNVFNNPKPQMIGAAGVRTFKFYGKKAGVTNVKFYKQRGSQAPIDSMNVLIVIEK